MPVTYRKIASVTVGSGGAADIEFISIPATYTDLVVKLSSRSSGTAANGWINGALTFNGSGSNYSGILLVGRGDLAPASLPNSSTSIDFAFYSSESNTTANTFSNNEIYIPNYASSNNKSVSSDITEETNAARAILGFNAGLWSDSAVITSIKLQNASGNFLQYSSATLYGIKKD
jgi:hypothetical protein